MRLVFHDCNGGCDGSLNLSNSDNRGLEATIFKLGSIFNKFSLVFSPYLTQADFWALVMCRALAYGLKTGNSIPFSDTYPDFVYGRPTNKNATADDFEGVFPDGIANWSTITTNLKAGLNGIIQTNDSDIVTLLGLHGAGSAAENNSGFQGPWGNPNIRTSNPNVINSDLNNVTNAFYMNLAGYTFPQQNAFQVKSAFGPNPDGTSTPQYQSLPPTYNKIQWVSNGNPGFRLMLNADMEIFHNITINSAGGLAQAAPRIPCVQGFNTTLIDCSKSNSAYIPLSQNAPQAFNYAKNSTSFVRDIVPAYKRILNSTSNGVLSSSYKTYYRSKAVVCTNHVKSCLGDVFLVCRGTC